MAGFDPATFWTLTPRQFVHRMRAARKRAGIEQARAAEAAWIGSNASHEDLSKYMDALTGIDRTLPPEALAGMLRSASNGLRTISRAEIHARRAH